MKRDQTQCYILRFLALRNLQMHALRTVLSATAVALGVAMLVSTGIIQSGIRNAWESGENKMAFITEIGSIVFNGVGVITLIAAGFLIFNAFAMTVTQQRRQIGGLRALGMTRRQVLRQILTEAFFTGGLGTLGGLALGPLLGHTILLSLQHTGLDIGRSTITPGSIALAIAMGISISILASVAPARRAARVAPLDALRESGSISSGMLTSSGKHQRKIRSDFVGIFVLITLLGYLLIAPPGTWSGEHPPWDWIMALALWAVWLFGLLLILPRLLTLATRAARGPLRRWGGVTGRLIGDNLTRAAHRLILTSLTFAVGLMMMVSIAGFVAFGNDVMVKRLAAKVLQQTTWYVYPFERTSGLAQLRGFEADAPGLEPEVINDIYRLAEGRAYVEAMYMIIAPEISSPFPGFPSVIVSDAAYLAERERFKLVEGTWDFALPIMEQTCGLLISPAVAGRHRVGVGDELTLPGYRGPVTCTVAGLGAGGFAPMSIIGPGATPDFVPNDKPPDSLQIHPLPGIDIVALDADLIALDVRHGDRAYVGRPEDELASITSTSDQLMRVFNGMVLLAIIAAALGMINTTLMSVTERQRELGLLRAVGATERQIIGDVMGEAALTGLWGTLLGILAGAGMSMIFVLAYGGATFGLMDLPLWQAASATLLPALRSGWLGIIAAPILAALAAYPATRYVLRGSPIDTLEGRQV